MCLSVYIPMYVYIYREREREEGEREREMIWAINVTPLRPPSPLAEPLRLCVRLEPRGTSGPKGSKYPIFKLSGPQ